MENQVNRSIVMKNKTILIVSGLLIVTGLGIYLYKRKKDKGGKSDPDNFKKLIVNLGNVKVPENNIINVLLNEGKNSANFYTNNRVILFEGKKQIDAGTYTNGGLTIAMDGKPSIISGSVYSNLSNALKTI